MTERPILFSAPMVRALLAGTKTQTRRALRVQPPANTMQVSTFHHPDPRPMFYAWVRDGGPVADHPTAGAEISEWPSVPCPYGKPGDRLWVREGFSGPHCMEAAPGLAAVPPSKWGRGSRIWYWADGNPEAGDWTKPRPGMFMPRWASRITLEVSEVRVERLQAISEADAVAEGIGRTASGHWLPGPCDHPEWAYHHLWDQINGAGAWDVNPWVWVVEFRRVTP